MTLDELRALITALETHGVEYVVIGAAALNALGIVRATEDIDIMVRPSADNVARLRRALGSLWDDPDIAQITAEDLSIASTPRAFEPASVSTRSDVVPVWKYRSVADMPPPPACEPGSQDHLQRWAALWARSTQLAGKRFRSGVFRYRSVAEADQAAEEMELRAASAASGVREAAPPDSTCTTRSSRNGSLDPGD